MRLDKFKVEALLAETGIGIMQFCESHGIKYQTIVYALNANNVRLTTVNRLAKALNVEPKEIIRKDY